mmetsp:Transcript_14305/g.45132  ORF Transcript_14305/g.45132 Transcript_14305/m.45132 type:complete len:228 (-) Transcript_14305:727-1410(-)
MVEAMEGWPRLVQSSWQRRVSRAPRRMVPPMAVLSISGMKTTATSALSSGSTNSAEVTRALPGSLALAYSMAMSCMPRQIPRKGVLVRRQCEMAAIMPSMPRLPKPPGTTTPSASRRDFQASSRTAGSTPSSTRWLLSIQRTSRRRLASMEECLRALKTLRYESWRPVYLPTMATRTVSTNSSIARAIAAQLAIAHDISVIPLSRASMSFSWRRRSTPCRWRRSGTW